MSNENLRERTLYADVMDYLHRHVEDWEAEREEAVSDA